jgi:hypothetical protein
MVETRDIRELENRNKEQWKLMSSGKAIIFDADFSMGK